MEHSLFVISGIDFTNHIVVPSYEVNEEDVYEEWTDGNKVNHHDVIRGRVTGSFDVRFTDETDYRTFINMINNKERGGYVIATVYINNKDTVAEKHLFIKCDVPNIVPFFGRMAEIDDISVELEEA